MRRSSVSSVVFALFCTSALAGPGCGGSVAETPAVDGGISAGTGGTGPREVTAGSSGSSATGGTASGIGGGTAGSSSKGGSGGKGGTTGKGGTGGTGAGGSGDLFDLDVPPEAQPCYDCAKVECKAELSQCNDDPQCVAVATCLLDQCAADQSTQCALGCLDANGLSLNDFNNPVVQTALGIGQCVQKGCADACQAPGAGGQSSGQGGKGSGQGGKSGGNGGSSGGAACSALACAQACGAQGFACSQDKECSPCLQNPSAPGCETNQAFLDSKACCNTNVAVCGGCTGCNALIDTGSAGSSAGGTGQGGAAAGGAGAGAGQGGEAAGGTGQGGGAAATAGAAGSP